MTFVGLDYVAEPNWLQGPGRAVQERGNVS